MAVTFAVADVQTGPSRVPVQVTDFFSNRKHDIVLEGGVLAVAQDDQGRLMPVCAWMLRPSRGDIASVADRIRAEHDWSPPSIPVHAADRFVFGPADFGGLYNEIEEATLFAGERPWRIRPPQEHEEILIERASGDRARATHFIDLPDGTFIGRLDGRERGWLYVRLTDSRQPSDAVSVLRGRLAEILTAALDSAGSIEFATLGTLADLFPTPRRDRPG